MTVGFLQDFSRMFSISGNLSSACYNVQPTFFSVPRLVFPILRLSSMIFGGVVTSRGGVGTSRGVVYIALQEATRPQLYLHASNTVINVRRHIKYHTGFKHFLC